MTVFTLTMQIVEINDQMGLSSTTTVNDGIQLCIFDLRRGQQEGQELDKILFFFPAECPFSVQLSVIGLCEGIITFTRFVQLSRCFRYLHLLLVKKKKKKKTCML